MLLILELQVNLGAGSYTQLGRVLQRCLCDNGANARRSAQCGFRHMSYGIVHSASLRQHKGADKSWTGQWPDNSIIQGAAFSAYGVSCHNVFRVDISIRLPPKRADLTIYFSVRAIH